MPLKRTQHWATREFNDHLIARAHAPHTYGENDCCTFAADGIKAMTGVDIAEDFRGYTTEAGALKAIKKITGGSTVDDVANYVAKKYELTELTHPLMAQRGDLVLVEQADGPLMGLVHLSGACVVAPGEVGLRRIALTAIKRAWRIG
jgi:hypothetical protein